MQGCNLKLLLPILVLFDGEGSGEGGAAEGQSAEAPVYQPKNAGRKNDLANVVYGKQDPDAGDHQVVSSDAAADRAERWQQARQEFKTEFDGEISNIVQKRIGDHKALESQLDAVSPVIDRLRDRYGVTDGDMDALMAAMDEDDSFWEQAADDAGMTVEQYKQFKRYERENAEMRAQLQAQQREDAAQQRLQQWWQEGETLKKQFPHFDLGTEAQNPAFLRLLESGVPVEHAFRVIHMDEINAGIAASTAKAAERQITSNIRARGSRPAEAGASGQSPFTVKNDVSKLTKKDRAEIARRAERGEVITF